MTPRPTLLVFTLGAARERARRPLLPAGHGGTEVALRRACLEAALEAGRQAGCRLVVSGPVGLEIAGDAVLQPQEGRGFGDRLERACRLAVDGPGAGGGAGAEELAAGTPSADPETAGAVDRTSPGTGRGGLAPPSARGPLVVVGTDVPGLRAEHLRRAVDAVEVDPECVVLGPSPDGGFYLLASARPLPGLAERTRWCRRDTLARLSRGLRRAGRRVVLLEPLRDLDRRADLERWLAESGGGPAAPNAEPETALDAPPRPFRRSGLPSPLAPVALLRRLRRRLAALLAALRRPPSWIAPAPLRPARVPVRSPRPPPALRR